MELEHLREKLDAINEEIIALLAKRRSVTKQVAELKKKENLPVLDEKRERLQIDKVREIAKKHALDPEIIEKLFDLFVAYCRREMAKDME